jgi:hypothetical protein
VDKAAPNYAFALLLHIASANKRVDQAVKCISAVLHDCAIVAWGIMCERLDGRSFARSLYMLDNLMLWQRPRQSLTEYVHFMRKSSDDNNASICEIIGGSAAIYPHHLGLLMLRGISSTGQLG